MYRVNKTRAMELDPLRESYLQNFSGNKLEGAYKGFKVDQRRHVLITDNHDRPTFGNLATLAALGSR